MALDVFISYSPKDKELRDELAAHLSTLRRQGLISDWHYGDVAPGAELKTEILTHLNKARLILLLISADFIASDFCYSIEMQQAIARHQANQARVVPIILRPTDWEGTPFSHLKPLPTDGRAVTSWPSHDDAFLDVLTGLRVAIKELSVTGSSDNRATPASANQKPIWTVPFRQNPFFTGREEVLTQLHTLLQSTSKAALSQTLAMSGLGGIGKTQTAVEYAYRHRNEYQVVCWIKSSTPEEIAEDFASIAQLLHLPEQQLQEQSHIIAAVKHWFETNAAWLLIFDNADNLALIADYLPQGNTGHILITTRAFATGDVAAKLEMQTMNRDEGTRLLLKRAKLINDTTSLEHVEEADLRLAYRIFEELGGLPLALDQAGAYLEETGEDLASYLSLYEEQRADLLRQRGGLGSDHAPVATTWTMAFQNLEDSNPAALELIRLYAFLAPDEIPEELLIGAAQHLGPVLQSLVTNLTRFNDAMKALLSYSLIQRYQKSKTVSIHRLVQAVIKDEMSKTQQAQWATRVVNMISRVFPFDEAGPWTRSQLYLSHSVLAVQYIKQWSLTGNNVLTLLNALGTYFKSRGQYSEAEPFYRDLRSLTERQLGPTHPDTASSLNNLANLYLDQGKYEQAEPLYRRALTVVEQRLGPTHPDTAKSLNNLANLYLDQGKYEQAEPLYRRALAIVEQRLGPTHPDTATSLNNLANLYLDQGKYEQAEPLYRRALAIVEQQLGPTHPDTASSLNNLANLYTDQGKYEQAELLYQRALAIREQRLGPTHPDTAGSLNNLANLYTDQGKYEQAELLYQRALAIREQRLGPTHPDTAGSLNNLGDLYTKQGKYEQAEPILQNSLAIREQRLGPTHPNIAISLNNLATLYTKQGKYEQAELLYQRALVIFDQSLGSDHPKTAESLSYFATHYLEQGKYEQAEPLYQRALAIYEQRLGPDHPMATKTRELYAQLRLKKQA